MRDRTGRDCDFCRKSNGCAFFRMESHGSMTCLETRLGFGHLSEANYEDVPYFEFVTYIGRLESFP